MNGGAAFFWWLLTMAAVVWYSGVRTHLGGA
jgi:hypothetical protein